MQRSAETKLNELRDEIKELKDRLIKLQSYSSKVTREKARLERELDLWKARAMKAESRGYEDVLPVKGQE